MTDIEKRANNIADAYGYIGLARQHIVEACIEMAIKQRAIDIDRAFTIYCIETCGHKRENCDCMSRMNIQKAMEEEI